jgi:hypothetical protein
MIALQDGKTHNCSLIIPALAPRSWALASTRPAFGSSDGLDDWSLSSTKVACTRLSVNMQSVEAPGSVRFDVGSINWIAVSNEERCE